MFFIFNLTFSKNNCKLISNKLYFIHTYKIKEYLNLFNSIQFNSIYFHLLFIFAVFQLKIKRRESIVKMSRIYQSSSSTTKTSTSSLPTASTSTKTSSVTINSSSSSSSANVSPTVSLNNLTKSMNNTNTISDGNLSFNFICPISYRLSFNAILTKTLFCFIYFFKQFR
jgi:hypothetical protein